MSRTQNIKRNFIFNTIKSLTQLMLKFVLRTALIYFLGANYLGLNGLFANIFGFLNLAELGIGSAIVFAMYKPIAENDFEKIKALQNLYKKFYLLIAFVIFSIGIILLPFLHLLIKDMSEVPVDINIYMLFGMYLFNSILSYFSAHKRSLLFAYQRNDIESKINTINIILTSVIQIIALLVFKNFYIYFSITILSTLLECIIIQIVANKCFPQLRGKAEHVDKETKKLITKNMAALSLHKIGGAVVFSTDNILLSSFCGILILGIYSNYALVIESLGLIFTLLSMSLTGSVGNLIACQEKEYTYIKFKQINFIFSLLTSFCVICLFVLFQPFMLTWTSKSENGPLLLEFSTILIICISFYLTKMRNGVGIFKECAGLFWQDRWKPIAEAIVNLVASIGLAYLIGINGIFLGTIISTLVAPFWVEPYVLHKHYFKKSVWPYFKRYAFDFVVMLIVGAVCYFICSLIPDGGVLLLLAKFAVCIVLCLGLLILFYFKTSEFKETKSLIKSMLGGKFLKKKLQASGITSAETQYKGQTDIKQEIENEEKLDEEQNIGDKIEGEKLNIEEKKE